MKKVLKFIIIFLIIIFLILIIKRIIEYKVLPKTSVNDFATIKELVEFDGHEYIDIKKSEDKNYKKDIYIKFSKPTINEDGTTNKNLYEILISHLAGKIKNEKFRIIDEEKALTILVNSKEDGLASYTINNEKNYWEKISSEYQIENIDEEKILDLNIVSPLLLSIINNNWIYKNINLGTQDSKIDNYEIYFDEGYKVRKIGAEIYNIIFTEKYENEIIENITTTTKIEEIETILGAPIYKSDDFNIIGYKSNNLYIFFNNGEVSVYPTDKYNENDSIKFGKIVSELNKTGDVDTFLNKLTDLYPDYQSYYKINDYINIKYPLRGFEVTLGASNNNGITIYKNFRGQITEDISIEDLKESKTLPTNVNISLDNNLVSTAEISRVSQDEFYRNPYDEAFEVQTTEYTVIKSDYNYSFYSRKKDNIDSTLSISNLTSILSYNDETFLYGVENDGIYMYNAINMYLNKIVEGNGKFNIEKIENNTIYYDDKEAKIMEE